jgi:hypothetical protein
VYEFHSLVCSVLNISSEYIFSNISCFGMSVIKENWAKLTKTPYICLYQKSIKWTLNKEFVKRSGQMNMFCFYE